jgi:hypothetical protein
MEKPLAVEEQNAIDAESERAHREELATAAAQKRQEVAEQASLLAVQREQAEIQLLAQQQSRLDNERKLLAETELLAEAETQASATLEERRITVQLAREYAQANAMLSEESILVAQQLATLEETGNQRMHAQIDQSRAEIMTRRLMVRLGRIRQVGVLGKTVGILSVMFLVGLSLKIDTVQPALAAQPVRAGMTHAGETVLGTARSGLKSGHAGSATYLVHGGLKLTDHLGE